MEPLIADPCLGCVATALYRESPSFGLDLENPGTPLVGSLQAVFDKFIQRKCAEAPKYSSAYALSLPPAIIAFLLSPVIKRQQFGKIFPACLPPL